MGKWPLGGKRVLAVNPLRRTTCGTHDGVVGKAKGYAGDRGGDTDGTRMSPISLQSTVRRIRRGGGAQVNVQALGRSASGWIAISIRVVVGAVRGNIFAPRRLRELPYLSKINSAAGGIRRTL